LQAGEVGLETDTGRFKIGNGTSVWQSLPYYLPDNNPSNVNIRQGKNLHDVYAKLSPLAESYSQTFTGSQVLVPNAADRTPLVVSGAAGQTGILQLWRTSAGATLASMDHTGKLTAVGGGVFSGQVNVNNNKIINLAIPTEPKDAVTKEYVDEIAQGLSVKPAVQAATTENLVGTYTNGTAGVGATLNIGPAVELDIDGWTTWALEDGVLVKDQTNKAHNGRYYIYQVGDVDTDWILIRCTACDEQDEIPSAYVFVQHGDTYANTGWVAAVEDLATFEVGVDDITWVQFSGAGTFTAGDGLVLDGPEFNVVGTADRITANADSIDIASTYVGQSSITTLGNVTTGTWSANVVDETKGGTGQSSYTIGDVLYADTTTSLAKLSPGTASYALLSGGSGTAPSYGQIQTGAIANDAVTYDKLQNISSRYRVLGRISTGAGNAEELTPDQLMETINQGITDIAFSLLPVGTTSTTVAQGDHTHTLDQLSDVEIGTPALRQVLKYDGTKWINELPSGGISIGATPPVDASSGDAWFDSTDGSLYVYYDDGVGSPARTNLITNPSFETNTSGWLSTGSSVTRDTSQFYSGTASARIAFADFGDRSIYFVESPFTPTISATAGQTYTFSIYVKQESDSSTAYASINWRNSSNDSISSNSGSEIATNSSGWTRVTLTATAPANTAFAVPSIFLYGRPAYIDAALFEQSGTANEYIEGTTPAGSSAQWVQVKANSALEASILTRVSALEARSTDIEAANAVRVADATERDSVYPAPVQGNTVFRADLGYEEKYYAAHDATTNPDGTKGTPGWYQYAGGAPLSQNVLLNADFNINQRNFSSLANTSGFGFDRWLLVTTTGATHTPQSFPLGFNLPGSKEAEKFARIVTSGQSGAGVYTLLGQKIENVRTFAGDTVTFSFWAKASSGTPKLAMEFEQNFGTGGSPSAVVAAHVGQVTLTDSWNRYFVTTTIPSISGKNIGTDINSSFLQANIWVSAGTDWNTRTNSLGIQSNTFDIWGVQIEQGPVPTSFRRNQPNIQAELAACKRYYQRYVGGVGCGLTGVAHTTTGIIMSYSLNTDMRIAPIPTASGQIWVSDQYATDQQAGSVTIASPQGTNASGGRITLGGFSGLTVGRWYSSPASTIGSGYIDFSAEL
jgi:hypothetical protein